MPVEHFTREQFEAPTLVKHQARQVFGETGFDGQERECPQCHHKSRTVGTRRPFGKPYVSCTTCHTELVKDWLESRC